MGSLTSKQKNSPWKGLECRWSMEEDPGIPRMTTRVIRHDDARAVEEVVSHDEAVAPVKSAQSINAKVDDAHSGEIRGQESSVQSAWAYLSRGVRDLRVGHLFSLALRSKQ
jgi:hypothetical protein